ncbi:MAG: response regulator transcription factor [Ignavibacteriales bacterium]|nr:MAG: response regulator transcription factor [Ignavibacteriales bacterium]
MAKILLIEDEDYIRENFFDIFSEDGYEVITASNGSDGIMLARKTLPDIILCDIMMDGINGYEVKEEISSHSETSRIPFIFLTAKSDLNDIRTGLSLGADDYITKPVSAKDLLKSVRNRLKRINDLKSFTDAHSVKPDVIKTERFIVKTSGKTDIVDIKQIVLISASGDYTTVHTADSKKIMMKRSLKNWEKNLDPGSFIRIHRNTILNISFIEKIEPMFKGAFAARIKHHHGTIHFSQRCSALIRKKLSLK